MKHQKILVIITALVLSMVNILLISNDDKVLASAGGGNDGDGNCNMGINLSYIWEITQKLANVTYDAYNETDIPRGRAFGSKGAQFTIDEILEPEMNYTIGLEDVHTEQIQHIPDSEKNYTSIINMTDFELTINNDNYPYENPVPKTEMYVIPNGYPYNDQGLLTGTNTLDNTKIIQNNITDLWPFAGTYNNYHLNITQDNYEQLNNINQLIIGNLTYLEPEDPPPSKESQHGRVYLLDDTSGCQNKIDNLTIANAGIIIDTGSKGLNYANAENSYLSIVSINENEGDTLKELLTNYTVLVDNITGNLTFTYNLAEGWWPTNNHVYIDRIPDHYELANITWSEGLLIKSIAKYISNRDEPTFVDYYACVNAKTLFWRIINIFRSFECKGVVLFDSHNYHFTMCTFNHWTGESLDEYTISEQFIEQTNMGPSLPVFTLNYTIGSWLLNNRVCTTLDGYADQELTVETPSNPGLEAYNVVGNITIDESPDDAVAIISNRMDGMWGQTPGDSGVGGGIVLGIAKYMKEYNIRPKYNLTFLFTTGEEFRFRGAYHYNDSHPEYNIKYWLILDQLGFDQIDQPLFLYYKNSSHGDILNETFLNQTQYWSRTGYVNITENGDGEGSEQGVASSRPECDSFCIVKGTNYSWDQWHRAGASYTDGDSISHIDRNDVNVTAELAWNVTKYFVVDPDCWFSNYEISSVDTDDADELVDSVDVNYTIESALPSDLLMVKAMIIDDENVVNSEWMNFTVNSPGYTGSIQVTLPSNCSPGEYNFTIILYNSTAVSYTHLRAHET